MSPRSQKRSSGWLCGRKLRKKLKTREKGKKTIDYSAENDFFLLPLLLPPPPPLVPLLLLLLLLLLAQTVFPAVKLPGTMALKSPMTDLGMTCL